MSIMERIDCYTQELINIEYVANGEVDIRPTHTMTYLNARRYYQKELGDTMGFDNDIEFKKYQRRHELKEDVVLDDIVA